MLRVQRSADRYVVFTLSGRMEAENITDLEILLRSEANGRRIVLDLRDVTLVNRAAVSFLDRCEADNITLENCPPYIREWIRRQRLVT
ncbi:MAG: hypothetical protein JWO80_1583 [Bryobacterales bacterium]|nr:hypothetical protein [Bryobacterales bacterium]